MLKPARGFLLAALIAAWCVQSPGQRGPAPRPSSNVASALDSLGMLQPESVKSILLLYSGKSISKSKVDELEADLKKTPDKIDDRLILIGYYTTNARTSMDHLRLRTHVLWMVENHPEHPATAEPGLRDLPDDNDGNAQIRVLWNKNLESRGDDLAVLKDAEKFFFGKDPEEADQLIHRIAQKEPNDKQWPGELAELYRMSGIPGERIDDPAARAIEAYKRVLELTHNPTARESLAGDLAQAAFKVGDLPGAVELAKIHLRSKDKTAVQRSNTILGRTALRSGDIAGAKQYLLDSSGPLAEKDVSISGPTLVLAKELLQHGEREVVLQYLDNCLSLWPRGEGVLQLWIADIKNGKTPNFGNLAN
jgi:tetratricopeptide (TPR) repeat protein